jgi:hypothetical protein
MVGGPSRHSGKPMTSVLMFPSNVIERLRQDEFDDSHFRRRGIADMGIASPSIFSACRKFEKPAT